jgi:dihydroflavonol-4-reductase
MNILVTGANGQLGAAVVRELIARGHAVRALIKPASDPTPLRGLRVGVVEADIVDRAAVCRAAAGAEAIVHSAAVVSYWPRRSSLTAQVNFQGTRNVIDAALFAGVGRFVHVGSASSFGSGTLETPGNEESPYTAGRYRVSYFDSKHAAQQAVLGAVAERGLPAVVVNPTFMVGPYGDSRGSSSLLLLLAGGRIPRVPPGGRNFVSTRDVAAATANALELGRAGECYILGHENLTYREAFVRFCAVLGVRPPERPAPAWALRAAGLAQSLGAALTRRPPALPYAAALMTCDPCYYDCSKAIRELALPQTPIEEAAAEAWKWLSGRSHRGRALAQPEPTSGERSRAI